MPNTRKKLIELLRSDMNVLKAAGTSATATLRLADNLIENGVTFATDNNVASKWIPASDPPKDTCEYWVAYQGGDGPCYTVGYFDGKHWRATSNTLAILPALYWMPILTLPEPPKGE